LKSEIHSENFRPLWGDVAKRQRGLDLKSKNILVGIWLRRARLRLGSGALFFGSFAFSELAVVKLVLKLCFFFCSPKANEQ
jgi:hypothetical protein